MKLNTSIRLTMTAVSIGLTAACAATPPCERDVEAYVMAQEFIRKDLKSPSTAEFPFMDRENTSVGTTTADGKCAFDVRINVDAQNGFGAMVRQRYSVTLAPDLNGSNEWSLVEISSY